MFGDFSSGCTVRSGFWLLTLGDYLGDGEFDLFDRLSPLGETAAGTYKFDAPGAYNLLFFY